MWLRYRREFPFPRPEKRETGKPKMNADSRGILRGQCTVIGCFCNCYSGGESGFKCLICNHPPAKHENLTNPLSSVASTSTSPHGPSQLQAASVPPDQSISVNASLTSASHPSFALGPQCQVPGCTQGAHFDLNTRSEYLFCLQHQISLPHLQRLALTRNEDYYEDPGATISPFQPQPLSMSPPSSFVPPQPLAVVSPPPQQQQVPYVGPGTLSSQSVPNLATFQSGPPQSLWQPLQAPQGPPPPQARK